MSYKYDVFISYKHAEVDSAVAQGLQKKLEHYKVPREIQKTHGKKKINRVFRDQEELSVGYNLAAEIEEQLKNSEFLVVLCSRASRQSAWVAKEVDTFLKYHSPQNILPILIDGEPEEAFPLRLLEEGEPFAADIRSASKKETLKKLESEVYRIIAPVLYCQYDELIQRNKKYRLQRILFASITAFILLSAFTVYVIRQNIQDRKAFMEQLLSESKILTKEAGDYIESDDYYTASKYLLQALPDPQSKDSIMRERPFYTPAAKLLTETTNMYKTSYTVNGDDECTAMYDNDSKINDVTMGNDDHFLLVTDDLHTHVIDTKSMEEKYIYTYAKSDTSGVFNELQLMGQTKVLLKDRKNLVCYDYAKGEIVWKKSFLNFFDYTIFQDANRAYVIDSDTTRLFVIDTENGEEKEEIALDLDNYFMNLKFNSVSDDGKKLLLTYYSKDRKQMLVLFDTEINKIADTYALEDSIAGGSFSPDGDSIVMAQESVSDKKEVSFTISLFDLKTEKVRWKKTFGRTMPGVNYGIKFGEGKNREKIIAYYGHALMEMNLSDGSVIREYPLEGAVRMITWEDDLIRVMTSKGVMFLATDEILNFSEADQSQIYGLMHWSNYPSTIYNACSDEDKTYYLQTEENRILKYMAALADPNIVHEEQASYDENGLDKISELSNDDFRVALYQFEYQWGKNHFAFIARDKKNGKTIAFKEEDILPRSAEEEKTALTPADDIGRDRYAILRDGLTEKEKEYEAFFAKSDDELVKDISLLSLEDNKASFLVCYKSYNDTAKYAAYQVSIDLKSYKKKVKQIFLSKDQINGKQILYDQGSLYTCHYSNLDHGIRIVKSDLKTRKTEIINIPVKISYDIQVISSKKNLIFYILDKKYAKLHAIEAKSGENLFDIDISDYIYQNNDMEEFTLTESEDGKYIATAEQSGIHVYDMSGANICHVDYERKIGEEENLIDLLGGISIDPEGKYLYYLAFDKLYQCRLSDGVIVNDIDLPSYGESLKAAMFHYDTFSYDAGKTTKPVLDIVFASTKIQLGKKSNAMCEIYLEESNFGLLYQANCAYDIDAETGRIYTIDKNVSEKTCHLGYFDRYSYEDMITMGKERAKNEE
ncbi:MAG: TIR domain-containing protein [Eubacteriales bacterium]|nr:TIR domain-containing protein [Eubacteriales bacterium]